MLTSPCYIVYLGDVHGLVDMVVSGKPTHHQKIRAKMGWFFPPICGNIGDGVWHCPTSIFTNHGTPPHGLIVHPSLHGCGLSQAGR